MQWLSGRALDSRKKGHGFKPHCVVSLSKNINPSLVLVQPRKTCPYITERLLMGRKESNQQTNKTKFIKASKAAGVGGAKWVNEVMVSEKDWIAEFTNGKQSLVRYSKTCLKRPLKNRQNKDL